MPRTTSRSKPACSIERALDTIGHGWSLLIVRNVFYGIRRFGSLRSNLGVSRKVLSERLDSLERDGVLEKRRYQERPPRHEYRLTPMGVDLFPILMALMRWGDRWLSGTEGAPLELLHARCGKPQAATWSCRDCDEPLGAHNVRLRIGRLPRKQLESFEQAAGRRIFERA